MPSVGVNLPSIYHLDLARNKLAGSIPDGFVQGISNVVKLKLNDNQLSGSLPHSLALCKRLTMLRLESNMLEGQIPPQLSTLASLVEASFRDNRLTGARSWLALPPRSLVLTLLRATTRIRSNQAHCHSDSAISTCPMSLPIPPHDR